MYFLLVRNDYLSFIFSFHISIEKYKFIKLGSPPTMNRPKGARAAKPKIQLIKPFYL